MGAAARAIRDEVVRALNAKVKQEGIDPSQSAPVLRVSKEEITELTQIARRHAQCADRLHRVAQGQSKGQLNSVRDHFLSSFNARLCAAIRALTKCRMPATLEEIYGFAESLDVWERLSEPVRVRAVPKSKGGFRSLVKYGPRRMAQQFIVRDLLTAMDVDSDCDYSRRGAGGEKAFIRTICRLIGEGCPHWESTDIQECFASLRPGHFGSLPLPEKLLRNVVFLPKCAKIKVVWTSDMMAIAKSGSPKGNSVGNTTTTLHQTINMVTEKVRQGLPQGAVLSPLIARAFVGRELRVALGGQEVEALSFCDDLALGACTASGARAALDALRKRLKSHPAGPISLHISPVAKGSVQVLGYKLTPGKGYNGNPVHVCPGGKRFERFHRRNFAKWKEEGCPDDIEAFLERRVDLWMPSQQAWTVVPAYSKNLAWTVATVRLLEAMS
jgi:hypothetical protein